MKTVNLSLGGKYYDSVYEFKPNMASRSTWSVEAFYWSKKDGYLRFVTYDGKFHDLINKFNSEEILTRIRQNELEKWNGRL